MRVNIAQPTPLSPPSPPHNASSSSFYPTTKLRLHRSPSATILTTTLATTSTTLCRSKSTDLNLRRSCSASFEGNDFPHHQDFTPKQTNSHNKKLKFPSFHRNTTTTTTTAMPSFRHSDSQVDVLEPSLLGIRPDPPDWPARDAVIRDCIARRASSIELPLSLRMLKMKQKFQRLEEEREIGDLEEYIKDNPINNLCCSTLYIIKEVQTHALRSRGLVLDEELDNGVLSKIQREMTSSFIWLFREVFAKTPDLMVEIMLLTSNFAAVSLESLLPFENTQEVLEQNSRNWGVGQLEIEKPGVELEEKEKGLWDSMVEEANEIGGYVKNERLGFVVVDHDYVKDRDIDSKIEFVSPVGVEVERDDYEEYYRTDLLYQMGLFKEPSNTLLLSNYAQFLCLVSRDYDRAEECFKRAIQLDPTDAEVMTQYANFLWVVRKDLWGAEERFQQATAAEPDNSYHASKYANFLWSTGGEDTCYPLDPPCAMS
ncbi:hypothetical protein SOVF_106320 [Spinacia oleracea]|uniref:Uncharacterized protein n=1 Tax=Spinacia oleracea TaxID=3562 RepID=A0A9R0JAA9_SPIOL|nr:uncharacterized protein LOC110802187 [Spinacia oleracea]KNA14568.1 hypothetical protein SOVF_106320 [Spinacia oleracea]